MKFLKRTIAVLLLLCTVLMLFGPWLALDTTGKQWIGGSPNTLFTDCLHGVGQLLTNLGPKDPDSHVLFISPADALADSQLSPVETYSLLYWLNGVGEEIRSYMDQPVFRLLLDAQEDLVSSLDSVLSGVSQACRVLPVLLGIYLLLCLIAILGTCSGHYNLTWFLFFYALLLSAAYFVLGYMMNDMIASFAAEADNALASLPALLPEFSDTELTSSLNIMELLQSLRFVPGLAGLASVLLCLVSRVLCFIPEKK